MNGIIKHVSLLLLVGLQLQAIAQSITLEGKVTDAKDNAPIPYATVVIKHNVSEAVLGATVTNENGAFTLSTDSINIFIEASFIGYQKAFVRDISGKPGTQNIGTITLEPDVEMLNEVVVQGEKSTVEFKLDKKVFNVGEDLSSSGMGAMEVLDNVPSVNVDIEGNISLRGNSGVQILINGKPSVMSDEGSNALGTITADMIESVEVITNPSAKYEAGGTSGIINIILKKEEKKGVNGSMSINTGLPTNHSIGISLNKRTEKFNLFTQLGGGRRSIPTYYNNINENLQTQDRIETDGVGYRNETFYNITLGTDYYLNDFNTITLSGNFALELEDQPSISTFEFYRADTLLSSWKRDEVTDAVNPKYQYDLQYKRQFKNNEDHVLLMSTLGKFFGKDLTSAFTNSSIIGNEVNNYQETASNFYQADYIFKVDYTNPLTSKVTLESGAQYEINDVGNDYAVYNEIGDVLQLDSNFSNNFEYDQHVLGVYSTGAYEGDKWGVKAGLRLENTHLETLLTNTNERNTQDYFNFFPTLHSSYKFSNFFSVQAGYSRRIFRPRLWDLNPFFNIRNNFNIRQGNPKLEPEFSDSYEFTGIFVFEKFFINSSIYHLYTTNLIDRITIADGNVTITKPLNIGTRNKTGLELNGKYSPTKKLTFNGDFNYGIFSRNGEFNGQDFSFSSSQWSSQLTAKWKLPAEFEAELTGNYESSYQTVQGTRSGFLFANAGVRKKLWDGKVIVNANVRDIFASRIRETIVDQEELYIYNFSQRGRFITLGLSYSFGKGEAMTYSGRHHH